MVLLMLENRTVLVADLHSGAQTIRNILSGRDNISVINTHTFAEAAAALDKNKINLIVCGLHFEQSRMFDFLRIVQADPKTRSIPFICFRDLNSDLSLPVLEGLNIASKALGAIDFIDLYHLKSLNGVENADQYFREILLNHLK